MLKVTVEKISPSPSGLVMGLRIEYGKDGPIRFAQASIPWAEWSREDRANTLAAFNRMVGDTMAAEPAEEPLPGL